MRAVDHSKITFSEQLIALACRSTLIEAYRKDIKKPHTFFQLLKHFLATITAEDPSKFHYSIARKALHYVDRDAVDNERSIDMLARELCKACHTLNEQLKMPPICARLLRHEHIDPQIALDPYIIIVELPKAYAALDTHFFMPTGLSIWDHEYLKLLDSIGPIGKRQSRELMKKFTTSDLKWNQYFWFKGDDLKNGNYFFHSPAFLGLAATLWMNTMK